MNANVATKKQVPQKGLANLLNIISFHPTLSKNFQSGLMRQSKVLALNDLYNIKKEIRGLKSQPRPVKIGLYHRKRIQILLISNGFIYNNYMDTILIALIACGDIMTTNSAWTETVLTFSCDRTWRITV